MTSKTCLSSHNMSDKLKIKIIHQNTIYLKYIKFIIKNFTLVNLKYVDFDNNKHLKTSYLNQNYLLP